RPQLGVEVPRHLEQIDLFEFVANLDVGAPQPRESDQVRQDVLTLLEGTHHRHGKADHVRAAHRERKLYEGLRVVHRKVAKGDRVQHAEHGRRRPDAGRERYHGEHRSDRLLAKGPEDESEVLQHVRYYSWSRIKDDLGYRTKGRDEGNRGVAHDTQMRMRLAPRRAVGPAP